MGRSSRRGSWFWWRQSRWRWRSCWRLCWWRFSRGTGFLRRRLSSGASFPWDYYPGLDSSYPYDYYYGSPSDYYNYDPYNYDDQSAYGPSDQYAPDTTIGAVQTQLAKLGYYNGVIDGTLGDQTEAALARYQENQDLSVTGTVDTATLQSLGIR